MTHHRDDPPCPECGERPGLLHAEIERLTKERDALRVALIAIFEVGDGFNANTIGRPVGTTEEGHARCREIARRTLDHGQEAP